VTVAEMMDALATQLTAVLAGTAVPNLQVENRHHPNPTPPAIDVYPASPFTEAIAYGKTRQYWFTIRARVATPDHEGAQDLLLSMMDDGSPQSVEEAIRAIKTYAGAQLGDVAGPTEFGIFVDPEGEGAYLGCTWRVALIP